MYLKKEKEEEFVELLCSLAWFPAGESTAEDRKRNFFVYVDPPCTSVRHRTGLVVEILAGSNANRLKHFVMTCLEDELLRAAQKEAKVESTRNEL